MNDPRGRRQSVPAELVAALAEREERLAGFARTLVYYESVGSTNDVANGLARDGAQHGAVVAATSQSHGRGRMGRTWFSPPGSGLYVSVVLRPAAFAPREPPPATQTVTVASSVTLTAGVALAEATWEVTGLRADIKWPNDLVVDRRKFCGILAEASAGADGIEYAILGFGINVRTKDFPPALLASATSIELELGRSVDEHALLAESLARLSERLGSLREGGFDQVLSRWRELSPSSVDGHVEVRTSGDDWQAARTAGIDRDGALLVFVGGKLQRVIAGEVRWL